MMYEALLFDMNALGDIPDKDFTSRASLAGSSRWRKETEAEAGSPPSLEARTSHFQGGRDRVALAFKLLGPEPHVSHPHKQQSVDRGSHTAESTRNGLGAETAELGSQPDSLKQTLQGEAWDPAFSNQVPPAPAGRQLQPDREGCSSCLPSSTELNCHLEYLQTRTADAGEC